MDSGTGDAAVSRTSPMRAGWMGLLTGRAGRAVFAAGTGTGAMTLAGQWTDARRAMGRLHRSGPRRQPESSPGGSSSASDHRAPRLSAALSVSRAGSVACYAGGFLVAFAALLTLALQAEAQKTTFVSNTGQSTATSLRGIGPTGIGSFFYSQAQRFSTGSNEGGYTLSAIQVQADNFESASSPRVSIYTVTSDNPGTLLYVLTNPATLNDNAINTFRAPANATLEKDTDYFVVFEATGSGSNTRYDLKGTVSANEDSGTASGWSIADTSRERATNSGNWSSVFARLKIAVRGTLPPAISIADASAAENAGHLMFDVTLSRSFQNTVKVDFETISGGTATEGVDYHARRTYTHVILEGDKTAQMGFALIEDTVTEQPDETVMVRLSNARVVDAYGNKIKDLDITRAEATGTITAPTTTTTNVPGLTIRIQDATGSEDSGWLVFKVKLSNAYDDYVCYDFETISGGTATEGMDYLKFPKVTYWMQIGKRVDEPFVRIIDDRVTEGVETVKVKISNAHLCDDPSQTISITEAEATGTITETSSSGMDSSDDGDGDDALLARVGDVTPEAATAALFGGDALTGDQLAAMDQLGNRNGAYDLGDLLSWRARCHRNEVSCGAIVSATDAGSLPASPAMPPTKRNGRTPSRRRGGVRAGRRSGSNMGGSVERVPQQRAMRSGVGHGPGRHGPAVRRATGWIRALALGLVVSAWGCRIGDNPVQPAQPDPGPLHVQLTVPPEARDIGAMLIVEGPGIDSLSAPGFELIQVDEASSSRREAIIAGSLSTGPVLQVWVQDRRHLGDYRVTLMQVSGDDYGLKDVTQYGIMISR